MPVLLAVAVLLVVLAVAGGLALNPLLWFVLILAALIVVFGTVRRY